MYKLKEINFGDLNIYEEEEPDTFDQEKMETVLE